MFTHEELNDLRAGKSVLLLQAQNQYQQNNVTIQRLQTNNEELIPTINKLQSLVDKIDAGISALPA